MRGEYQLEFIQRMWNTKQKGENMSGERFDNGYIKDSSSRTSGRVRDYTIRGMEREKDVIIVAAYRFLVKNLVKVPNGTFYIFENSVKNIYCSYCK